MAVVKFLWPYNVFYSEFFAVFGSFFYNMRDLLTVRRVNLLALRLSYSSHEERFHVGYIASFILFLFCFLLFQFVLKV